MSNAEMTDDFGLLEKLCIFVEFRLFEFAQENYLVNGKCSVLTSLLTFFCKSLLSKVKLNKGGASFKVTLYNYMKKSNKHNIFLPLRHASRIADPERKSETNSTYVSLQYELLS